MRFAQLGTAAALAAVSRAFLIPSTISAAYTDDALPLPFEATAITGERVVEVDCPGCPVQTTDKGVMHWGNVESVLRLNFTVERSNPDKLMMNGLQIYPISTSMDKLMSPLKADQLIKSPDGTWVYTSSPTLGYGLSMRHPFNEETRTKNGMGLVDFQLEIIEVAEKFIRGIPRVSLSVVETKSGQLMIGDAQLQTPTSSSPRPGDSNQECSTLLCRWKAILAAKASALKKGCGSKARPNRLPRPHGIKGGPNKFPHHRPHHGSFRHGHRRPHHGFISRLFRSVTFHILVPVLIGVAVGILASIVGMVVGHIAIFFWRLFFRRGERGQYCRVEQDETSTDNDDDTKAFLEKQDAPPVYEDAVVVVEEKAEQK